MATTMYDQYSMEHRMAYEREVMERQLRGADLMRSAMPKGEQALLFGVADRASNPAAIPQTESHINNDLLLLLENVI
jgi:hypothetical protein